MNDNELQKLKHIIVADYIQKATALISHPRKVGGNQFRHAMATFAILIDYHYIDPVLLKAALLHDLFEDVGMENYDIIAALGEEGKQVAELVMEVTRIQGGDKEDYLKNIRDNASKKAKILKVADRISNMTDLNLDIYDVSFVNRYIYETEEYIYPIALEVNENMATEINDLIQRRKKLVEKLNG